MRIRYPYSDDVARWMVSVFRWRGRWMMQGSCNKTLLEPWIEGEGANLCSHEMSYTVLESQLRTYRFTLQYTYWGFAIWYIVGYSARVGVHPKFAILILLVCAYQRVPSFDLLVPKFDRNAHGTHCADIVVPGPWTVSTSNYLYCNAGCANKWVLRNTNPHINRGSGLHILTVYWYSVVIIIIWLIWHWQSSHISISRIPFN